MTAGELFTNYGIVIVEFLFELYVFFFMVSFRLERKSRFLIRAILLTAAVFASSIGVAAFYTAFGETFWGRAIVYIALFGMVFGQGVLLFNEKIWTVLFCAVAAYAVQNLIYNVYLFQYYLGKLAGIYRFDGSALGTFLYRLMYYTVFGVLAVAMWLLAIRRMCKRLPIEQLNYKIFTAAVFILIVSVILCSVEDIYFARAGLDVYRFAVAADDLFALRLSSLVMNAVGCVAILIIMYKTLEQRGLQRDVDQLRHAIRQSEQQYRISKDTIDMINIKCHDIKYKLDAAIKDGASPDAVDDLKRSIAIYDSNIETGNKLLNVLFTEKSLYCEQNGITLSCMIDGARLSFMDDGDLYCLFGNIADNALEAVTKIKERERRVIDIVVKAKDDMVIVTAENFFAGTLELTEEGLPVTSKDDKNYHGFGTASMRMIVHKYGGEMIIDTDGDVFRLTALFPSAEKSKGESAT